MTKALILSETQIVGRGTYASVFRVGDYAIKLFSMPAGLQVRSISADPVEVGDRRAVLAAERDAYLIASRTPVIGPHVPAFYGSVDIADVLGLSGESIIHRFLAECAYVMGYIDGRPQDVLPYEMPSHIGVFIEQMNRAGIERTDDMIAWHMHSPTEFILADFGTHDARFYAEYDRMGLAHPPAPTPPLSHGAVGSDLANPFLVGDPPADR